MRGILCAMAAAVLFGASAPLAKMLLGQIGPWMLAGLLYLGSGIGLTVLRPVLPRGGAPIVGRDWIWLAAAIVSGGVIGPVLLMLGLTHGSASSAALLLNLEGVLTLTLAWVVFREGVDLRIGLGALAILAGAAILSWPERVPDGGWDWGGVAIAAACLAWAIDNNLTRKVSSADPVELARLKGLVAGGVNTALAFLQNGLVVPPGESLAFAGLVGLAGYGLSLVLFVIALRELGAARTGAYFAVAPFAGAVLAVPLLDEPVTLSLLMAGGLMAVGVWLHLTEKHNHDHAHDPVEHDHPHRHDDGHHDHAHSEGTPEEHNHPHVHGRLIHRHPHYPDWHHRHGH